ncbi:hypothetical protein EYB45_04465 [Erythrobacteraceae bacterium CFH 75059]|uniref:regulatory protein RecX n=1 Tax=Qipengyuania thermophila TaxID=2509361 RepID=UPI00101EA917|nr:RecX family transcriptional regulator [Qipengyuania thermophila]TCD04808.1 hypothetical protein EYB45_04465 [Erythrobacteraceae bacterium CFH 75059]
MDRRRSRQKPRPLTAARLDELALAYVARFATSTGKLETYLRRKLRERGWDAEGSAGGGIPDDGDAAVQAIVQRFVAAGYVDDAAFAQGRARALAQRGYGARRVDAALRAAGIDAPLRTRSGPSPRQQREAVLALARRRRIGPFADASHIGASDPAARQKALAMLLRAGHEPDMARAVLALRTPQEADAWLADTDQDRHEDGGKGW